MTLNEAIERARRAVEVSRPLPAEVVRLLLAELDRREKVAGR